MYPYFRKKKVTANAHRLVTLNQTTIQEADLRHPSFSKSPTNSTMLMYM